MSFSVPAETIVVARLALAVCANLGAQPLCADEPLHHRIDRLIAAATADYDSEPSRIADDAEFVRRIWLDLAGMPPSPDEARAFFADENPKKRAELIDRLLGSPEYARHMQRVLDVMLMRRLPAKNVTEAEWEQWLRRAVAENRPWDQIVREVLTADGTDPKERGPARFYLDREADVNELTRDIGRIFLGADLECAQCHDHPEVLDWAQADYYGVSAFLVRTSVFKDPKLKKTVLAEKADGEVSFESVFEVRDKTSGGPKSTPPRLFEGTAIDDPQIQKGKEYEVKPAKNVRPVPTYSRLAQLPDALVSSRRFARTAVNRFWAVMFGRGLVHPVDMDHSLNPPSHPELLELLTDEFIAHGYDIKWLLREFALSDTYERSSRCDASQAPAHEAAFAQAILKPLRPAQFAWAVLQVTGQADVQRTALGEKLTEESLHAKLASYEDRFVRLFGGRPGQPPEDFESTVDQVLFLSNDGLILGLIRPKKGNLAQRLLDVPADDPQAIADELFLSVLVRQPSEEDVRDVAEHLDGKTGVDRQAAVEELIWALIASTEFRFNH